MVERVCRVDVPVVQLEAIKSFHLQISRCLVFMLDKVRVC
jgi:hypothetical protein